MKKKRTSALFLLGALGLCTLSFMLWASVRPPGVGTIVEAKEYAVTNTTVTITIPESNRTQWFSIRNGSSLHASTSPVYITYDGTTPDPTADPAT